MEKIKDRLEKIPVLDASLMILEAISTDARAPSQAAQREAIRADGTAPQKAFKFPADFDLADHMFYKGEADVLCVAHPRVIGPPSRARKVLTAMFRAEASLKLPDEPPVFIDGDAAIDGVLALLARTPWGRGTRKQKAKAGRKPKRKQPNATQKATYCRMWAQPDQFKPKQIRALASEELGRDVAHWELKYWCGDSRNADEEGKE